MKPATVAKYLTQQIAICGKSQRELAEACGYPKPNIITMFKTGATKLPLTTVAPLARALDVDPGYLLRLAMMEYMPETWDALQAVLGPDKLITSNERNLLELVRRYAAGHELDLTRKEHELALVTTIQQIVASDQARADASVTALNALPRNGRPKGTNGSLSSNAG